MPVTEFLDAEMVAKYVEVAAEDVVYVKGIFEASEGLAALFAESGGDLVIIAPRSRECELDELLLDLTHEIGAVVVEFDDQI